MKHIILYYIGFICIQVYSQTNGHYFSETDKLTDKQLENIIAEYFTEDTIENYYGIYLKDGLAEYKYGYGYERIYKSLEDKNFGPCITDELIFNYISESLGAKTDIKLVSKEVFNLFPPYNFLFSESNTYVNEQKMSSIKCKKIDSMCLINRMNNQKSEKEDTLINFTYSLNDHWIADLLCLDTNRKDSKLIGLSFEDGEFSIDTLKLVSRKPKIVNGIEHVYTTLESLDTLGNIIQYVIDDNYRMIKGDIPPNFTMRLEKKEDAMNLEKITDLFLLNLLPVDIDYANELNSISAEDILKVKFEIKNDTSNVFESNMQQIVINKSDNSFLNIDLTVDYVDRVSDNEIEKNLEATEFYPIMDTIIINMAKKATHDGKSINQKVTLLLNFVSEYIEDTYTIGDHYSVYDIIKYKNGDCSEHSFLFNVLARSIGIPSRQVIGYSFDSESSSLGGHAWNEVAIDGKWYGVDPTWNIWLPSLYHFKSGKNDHIFNNTSLKLKNIRFKDGTVKEFD